MPLRKVVLDKFSWQSSENEHTRGDWTTYNNKTPVESKKKSVIHFQRQKAFFGKRVAVFASIASHARPEEMKRLFAK
jgi:hypothetical protein